MPEVDSERVGEFGGTVSVLVVPFVTVELCGGRLVILAFYHALYFYRVEFLGSSVYWRLSCQQVLRHCGAGRENKKQ